MSRVDRQPAPAPGISHYVHGTDPAEQHRLTRLNDLINGRSLDALALTGNERVLDVGAGLAQFARAMARTGASVTGIERSGEQIAEAMRQMAGTGDSSRVSGESERVELRRGEATALPLAADEWGAFDVAHARFLLEHVPDPLAVVRAMVRAVRPGGRIVLEDDDHDLLRLWPEPPGLDTLWRAYIRTYDRLGNDPFIGRRLVALLHQAGAQPVKSTWLFFGACAGDPDFEGFALNLIAVLEGAGAAIRETGGIDEAAFATTIAALHGWRRRPDAAIWYAVAWAEARRAC